MVDRQQALGQLKHILLSKVGLTLKDGVAEVRAADEEVLWGKDCVSQHHVFPFMFF